MGCVSGWVWAAVFGVCGLVVLLCGLVISVFPVLVWDCGGCDLWVGIAFWFVVSLILGLLVDWFAAVFWFVFYAWYAFVGLLFLA